MFGGITFQEDQFMRTVQLGMKAKADALGIEMLMGNSDNKLEKEVELINNYIERGVDAICVVPLSPDGSVPALKRAAEKGIKIIVANIGIKADFQSIFIDSDNYALGSGTAKFAVDFIKKNLGGKAKIATLAFESQIKELSKKVSVSSPGGIGGPDYGEIRFHDLLDPGALNFHDHGWTGLPAGRRGAQSRPVNLPDRIRSHWNRVEFEEPRMGRFSRLGLHLAADCLEPFRAHLVLETRKLGGDLAQHGVRP